MSVPALCNPTCASPHLTTLDFDQTELGDSEVAQLFNHFFQKYTGLYFPSLENLYLNGTGISTSACTAISTYLSHPLCKLRSLYLSINPISNFVFVLAPGLAKNNSLTRLTLSSCDLSSKGIRALLFTLTGYQTLAYLDIDQSYTTRDLGAHCNYPDDITWMEEVPLVEDVIVKFIKKNPKLAHARPRHHHPLTFHHRSGRSSGIVLGTCALRGPLCAAGLESEDLRRKETSKLVRAHLFKMCRSSIRQRNTLLMRSSSRES